MTLNQTDLRVGVIGVGAITEDIHGPSLGRIEGVRLWSVLSRDPNRGAAFAQKHGAAAPTPAHTSLEAFLADPALDAVIVASPDKIHAEQVLACARARKHVLVEKPLTTRREDGLAAIAACEQSGVKLAVGLHHRWHAGHRLLHRRIWDDGALGQLRHIRVQFAYRTPSASDWRASADLGQWWSLSATGAHCLDLVRWFARAPHVPPADLRCLTSGQVWGLAHDETSIVTLRFDDGMTAECTASVVFNAPTRVEIYGSDNYAVCEGTLGRKGAGAISIGGAELAFEPVIPFDDQLRDFAAAIREDRAPEADGYVGLQNVDDIADADADARSPRR